jgi:hypothetical protein
MSMFLLEEFWRLFGFFVWNVAEAFSSIAEAF